MRKLSTLVITFVMATLMAVALAGCSASNSNSTSSNSGASQALRLSTGGEAGVYYAYGNILAQYAVNNYGMTITVVSSDG